MWIKSCRRPLVRFVAAFLVVAAICVVGMPAPDAANARRAEAPSTSGARSGAKQMAAGNYFTCWLAGNGTIRCWGDRTYGQLGNGVVNPAGSETSVEVTGISNATEVVAGAYHACALLADTRVKCWGYGMYGQLGHGSFGANGSDTSANRATPVYVKDPTGSTDLTGVSAISAGYWQTCAAFVADGSVKCWGSPGMGALGNGVMGDGSLASSVPLPVAVKIDASTPLTGVTELVAGASGFGGCALLSSGRMRCWGGNGSGQLGDGTFTSNAYAASEFRTSGGAVTDVLGMSAGSSHNCAITASAIYCAGRGDSTYGQSSASAWAVPRPESNVQQVVASGHATCLLRSDGTVLCAGEIAADSSAMSFVGPSGAQGTSRETSFVSIGGLTGVSALVSGWAHFCAFTSADLKCWGLNNYGQLGVVTAASTSGPVAVAGLAPTTVTIDDPGPKTVDSPAFDLSATASSGATVAFTVASGSAGQCSVSGVRVTILGAGDCVINAVAPSSGAYAQETESLTISIAPLAPTVGIGSTGSLTMSGATVSATVNAKGATTTVSLEYSLTESFDAITVLASATSPTGISGTSVSVDVASLAPGTAYYFRFVATNSLGTTRGATATFTTKGSKPTVVTGSATRGSAGMTVNGKVNAKELETSFRFEYGTSSSLVGSSFTAARTQDGADDADVSAIIAGLADNTTYYYRLVASNVVGAAEGDIRSFTTARPEGVSINDAAEFTSSVKVVVSVVGPSTAVKAILSNDGGFRTSETFDLVNNSADINWTLQSSRDGTFSKTVYVRYISRFGSQLPQQVTDDIILDTSKPVVSSATAVAATPSGSAVQVARTGGVSAKVRAAGVRLSLRGSDTVSGVGSIEVRSASNRPTAKVRVQRFSGKADGTPRITAQTVLLRTAAKRLQVRVLDRAGNASAWRTVVVR